MAPVADLSSSMVIGDGPISVQKECIFQQITSLL